MLISQTPEEINLASAIFNQCAFESVNLTKCSAFGSENPKLLDPFKMSLKETESVSKGISDNRLSVDAKFIVESIDSSEPPNILFTVTCEYRLVYQLNEGVTPGLEQIDAFLKGNVLFNCWPYVREFIQNLAARMGHFPPPLPLLRIKQKSTEQTSPPTP